jgi:hypothetical protein
MTNETGKALEVIEGEYRDIVPVVTPAQARAAMEQYQQLAEAVTDPKEDYQTFRDTDGKEHRFRKRAGWKKLERFFFVSVEIREERIFHQHNPQTCLRVRMPEHFKDVTDCGCPVKGVRYWVRASDTRTGRYSDNLGICTAGEKRVPASASLHDLATRAFNRGANRSTADLLGVSDPSAEEREVEGGLTKEERVALKMAWDSADQDMRNSAIAAMGAAGASGGTAKDTYIDFLRRATPEQYEAVRDILAPPVADFNPEEVPSE